MGSREDGTAEARHAQRMSTKGKQKHRTDEGPCHFCNGTGVSWKPHKPASQYSDDELRTTPVYAAILKEMFRMTGEMSQAHGQAALGMTRKAIGELRKPMRGKPKIAIGL